MMGSSPTFAEPMHPLTKAVLVALAVVLAVGIAVGMVVHHQHAAHEQQVCMSEYGYDGYGPADAKAACS
jgi:hypothetical protein